MDWRECDADCSGSTPLAHQSAIAPPWFCDKLGAGDGCRGHLIYHNVGIGPVFAPYRPGGRHGNQFWHKKWSCGVVKSLFEARVRKARNGPSTQLIKATSWVERSNATREGGGGEAL